MIKEKPTTKRNLTRFLGFKNIEFGDYLLFQEYKQSNTDCDYEVSKPILAIYLGCFVADQTLGFNYVVWNNERHTVKITNQYVTNYPTCKEVDGVNNHIEWMDYIDILGHWKNKPKWKEIIKAYRKQNTNEKVLSEEINLLNN